MNDIIEGNIQQYIKIIPFSTKSEDSMHNLNSLFETISEFEQNTIDKIKDINEIIQRAVELYPPRSVRSKYTPKVCFIVNKYLNVFMKYQGIRFNRCQQVLTSIKQFKEAVSNLINQKILAEIYFWEYISFTLSQTEKHLRKLEFKLKSMYYYIQNLDKIERVSTFSNLEMYQELQNLISEVDLFNGIIRQNKFDLMFECYVESNNDLSTIFDQIITPSPKAIDSEDSNYHHFKIDKNEIVNNRTISNLILNSFDFFINSIKRKSAYFNKINKNNTKYQRHCNISIENRSDQNKIDFELFDHLVITSYNKIISLNDFNKKMYIIIRCAALRYLSNKYYIIHSNEWLEKPSPTYIDNIKKIVEQTPRSLAISNNIIPSSYCDISFQELLLDDDFKAAIDHFYTIQFYTCPIDIWNEVYSAATASMKAANKFTNAINGRSQIAFDDFFTILLPVFSSAQIACPNGLRSFLPIFIGIKKQNSLDISSTSILALLKIFETKISILNFNE